MNIEKLQYLINEMEEHLYALHPVDIDLRNSYRASIDELTRLIHELIR
jgi:hypothetical protein